VEVKLLPQENEVYVLARSRDRIHKERSMRRRQLKRLWKRLQELVGMELSRDQLLLKLGRPAAIALGLAVGANGDSEGEGPLQFSLRKDRLRRFGVERGVIYCERTWWGGSRRRCGSFIPSWFKWRKRSKT